MISFLRLRITKHSGCYHKPASTGDYWNNEKRVLRSNIIIRTVVTLVTVHPNNNSNLVAAWFATRPSSRSASCGIHHDHDLPRLIPIISTPNKRVFASLSGSILKDSSSSPSPCSTGNSDGADSPSTSSRIKLRNATLDDLPLLLAWDNQEHLQDENVMGDEDYNEWNWEYELPRNADLSWRYQLIAIAMPEEVPIGFVQIIDPSLEESHYWCQDDENDDSSNYCSPKLRAIDIWIGEPGYLGRGYGTEMMTLALKDYCFSHPNVQAAIVDPMAENSAAHCFYQKLGFQPERIQHFGPDRCLVHRLSRTDFVKDETQSAV